MEGSKKPSLEVTVEGRNGGFEYPLLHSVAVIVTADRVVVVLEAGDLLTEIQERNILKSRRSF